MTVISYSVVPTYNIEKWKNPSGDVFRLNQHMVFETDSKYGFPEIRPYKGDLPTDLVNFHEVTKGFSDDLWVHFNIDDYYFERVWSSPDRLLKIAQKCKGFLSTTFSIFEVQPYSMNLWNVYRNRWLTAFMQHHDINVIPCVLWADESTYDFAFDSLPKFATLAVSTVGTLKLDNRKMFVEGFKEMIYVLCPERLVVYGEHIPVDFTQWCDEVVYIDSDWKKRREKMKGIKQEEATVK